MAMAYCQRWSCGDKELLGPANARIVVDIGEPWYECPYCEQRAQGWRPQWPSSQQRPMIPRNETQQSPAQETDFVLALAQGSPLPAPITALQYAQNQSSQSTAPAPYIQQENGVGTLTPISPFEMKTQESLFQVRNMSLEQRYLRSDTILPYWRQDYQQDRLASVPFSQQLSSLFDNRCGAEEVTQLHRLEAFSPSLLPISGDGNGCQDITAFEFAETNHPVAEQERVIEGVERTQLNPSDSNSSFSL